MAGSLNQNDIKLLSKHLTAIYPDDVARLRDSDPSRFAKFKYDPIGYIRRVLRCEPTPDQIKLCNALMQWPHKVIAQSANNQGKCIEENEMIPLADGSLARAGDLVGKEFYVPSLIDGVVVPKKARAEWNLYEECYELATTTGIVIVRSHNHPVWSSHNSSVIRSVSSTRIEVGGWHTLKTICESNDHWYVAVAGDHGYEMNAVAGTRWQKVLYCAAIGGRQTVAIEVEDTHTFLTPIYEHNTFISGALVNWYYDCWNPGICITTAPTDREVKDLLWKEVRSQRKTRWDFRGDKMPEMYDKENHYAKGYTGTAETSFHGRHEENMFFVIDEATGVGEHVWRGIKSMFKPSGSHFWLCLLNPTDTTSTAYAECENRDEETSFTVVRMSALNHPNIIAALKGEEIPIKGAVDMYQLNQWFHDWFEEIHPDDRQAGDVVWPPDWSLEFGSLERIGKGRQRVLRPGIDGQARVLGLWPNASEWAVWSDKSWNSAIRKLPDQEPLTLEWYRPPEIGCDVSAGGGDKTEIVIQCDLIALDHRVGTSWEIPRTIMELKRYADHWAKEYNNHKQRSMPLISAKHIPIKVDDDGVGQAVTQTLKSEGYNAIGVGAGCVADKPQHYVLMRDQLWFAVVAAANQGLIDLTRLPEKSQVEMRRQAMAIRFDLDARGRRRIWKKEETRAIIGRSPDSMDALNLSFYSPTGSGTAPVVF